MNAQHELSTEPAGASFLCVLDGAGKSVEHHQTHYRRFVEPRSLAGNLLETLSEIVGEMQRLPDGYQIPDGVVTAILAAYETTIQWVDVLDSTPKMSER